MSNDIGTTPQAIGGGSVDQKDGNCPAQTAEHSKEKIEDPNIAARDQNIAAPFDANNFGDNDSTLQDKSSRSNVSELESASQDISSGTNENTLEMLKLTYDAPHEIGQSNTKVKGLPSGTLDEPLNDNIHVSGPSWKSDGDLDSTRVKQLASISTEDTEGTGHTSVKLVHDKPANERQEGCETDVKQIDLDDEAPSNTMEATNVKELGATGGQETIVKEVHDDSRVGCVDTLVKTAIVDDSMQSQAVKQDKSKIPMTEIHKGVLKRHEKELPTQLCSVDEILQYLYQEGALEEGELDSLQGMLNPTGPNDAAAVKQLLDILPLKSDYAYTAFRQGILDRSQQLHLVTLLDNACREIEQKTHGKDCFETYRVKKVPRYYVNRQEDVDCVLQMLDQKEVQTVGIVGSQLPIDSSDSESSEDESSSEEEDKKRAEIIGIRGWGGVGKTILALKVCEQMKTKLPVIWLSVGQRPNIVQLFNQIHADLTNKPGNFADQANASDWLRKHSETQHSFLLILDDVWSLNDASPFACIARKSKILITTRIQSVLNDLDATIYKLNPLDDQQSRRLLIKSAKLKTKYVDDNLGKIIDDILKLLGGLPLAIVLIGCSLKKDKFKIKDWEYTFKRMKSVKETFWEGGKHIPDDVYKYRNIYEAFEVSFQALNVEINPANSNGAPSWNIIQKRFLDFALFLDDVEVPSNVLFKLWKHQLSQEVTEKDEFDMHDNLEVLVDRSFLTLSKEYDDISYYTVHDLLLEYTRYKLRKSNASGLKEAHEELLACYSEGLVENGIMLWWKVENDGYIFSYLAHHLFETESYDVIRYLLWNIQWLERKLLETDIAALLLDFKYLTQIESKTKGKFRESEEDRLLRKSLVLSSHILSGFKDQICPQLVGRLVNHESFFIKELVREIKEYVRMQPQMLLPVASCLSPPDGYRIQSLRHFSTVISSALSSDKHYLYTGSADNQLRCFDLETNQVKIMGKDEQRHTGMVFCMAIEEKAGYIVTGSFDNNVHLWPITDSTFVEFKCFTGHTDSVFTVATIPDNNAIVSGGADRTIRIWDINTNSCSGVIENAHSNCVREVAVIRNGSNTIVSVGEESYIKMWDFKSKQLSRQWIGHNGYIYTVRVSPDNQRIVTGGKEDFLLKIWDIEGNFLQTCSGHNLDVFRCFITSDSQYILSGSLDKTARLWNINTGQEERTFYGHGQAIWALFVSDDNKLAVTGGEDQLAILWNCDLSDNVNDPLLKRHDLEVTSLTASLDGKLIVSASRDRTVKVWQWPSMDLVQTLHHHTDRVNCVIVSKHPHKPDKLAAFSGSNDKSICIWNLTPVEDSPLYVMENAHGYGITSLCATKSGQYLFSGSYGNTVHIHDTVSKDLLLTLNCHHHSSIRHLCIKESKLVAAFDGSVVFWELQPLLKQLQTQCLPSDSSYPISSSNYAEDNFGFSSTARPRIQGFIAGLGDVNKVRMLNVARLIEFRLDSPHKTQGDLVSAVSSDESDTLIWTGSLLGNVGCINRTSQPAQFHELTCPVKNPSMVTSIKVSPLQNHCIAGYNSGDLWVWSDKSDVFLSQPEPFLLCKLHSSIESIDMWETGEKCVVAVSTADYKDPSVCIWNLIENARLQILQGHTSKVTSLLFIRNGSKLITCSIDGSVKLWDVADGKCERNDQSGHRYGIASFAIDTQETIYASGGYENRIEVRSLSDGGLQTVLCTNEFFVCQNMYIRNANTIVCAFAREFFVEINIEDGKIVHTSFAMQKENGPVSHVVSCTRAVSGTTHCKAKLWDLTTGQTLCVLESGSTRALLSACTMESGYVVTGSYDKVVKVWDVSNTNSPVCVTSFAFEHAVTAVHEFTPEHLVVGLLNGQVCFLHVTTHENVSSVPRPS